MAANGGEVSDRYARARAMRAAIRAGRSNSSISRGARRQGTEAKEFEVPEQKPRRLPAPWAVVEISGGYAIVDAGGCRLAYVYKNTSHDQGVNSEALTEDEARRVAANIAKLPDLLAKAAKP
jgi:hypothetical protein